MKKNVILYKKIPQEQQARLAESFNLITFDGITSDNRAEFIAALAQADGLIGASVPIKQDLLQFAPKLKAISTISVGYDQFDVDDLTLRGIRLMHTPTVLTDTTADTIFTLVLATARRAVELSMLVRAGEWQRSIGDEYYGTDVHHKTIGILGMGRIGSAVAKRAHCGFDMKVLYMSNKPNIQVEQQYQAQRCSLDELLQRADFVCITLPLLPSTERLISAEKLALMKPSAILINGARGKIVDQQALVAALQNGTIKAAGLDVFEVEPLPPNSPLMALPNVVLLPHIGSATIETRYNMVRCAVDNMIVSLAEQPPNENWVNPQVG
ncbi:NAD(P)-dependent oxidoreductase [Testudinibacter sp. TR-2022]|uniref:NAD(P)-dependent oxidoreductase n=1 Tax=Testudinibacter sp. TR-2022 TaxID=2585029 RepID=UPI00111B6FF2|nr:NAD(P)-dependent oxidoreductase [Testudinibacter sp. TR-2022]TNH05568.1 bifunctional glyoxylate/hydroxypyruvate reductase B [Pasteurellaceae bacterium Phil11]TNH20417.1 bifunctional glyoxylate/hydroxypyruvate reductase B [Testudinibacter sp. TR-2022]TNH24608.1 bifunctional glyoxylate/hydroxypyruvate reductase B [Testudinibacter sp. TR-2022]